MSDLNLMADVEDVLRREVQPIIDKLAAVEKFLLDMQQAVLDLKRGDCWCEVGIGNPMVSGHSSACLRMKQLMGEQ